jgi:hypothetical protein
MRRSLAVLACLTSALAAPSVRAQGQAAPTSTDEAPAAPEAPAPPLAEQAPPFAPAFQPGQAVVVILKDGQKLQGTLVSQDSEGIALDVSGARMQLPTRSIERLVQPGSEAVGWAWPRDANRTRYLYSPSGFMLRQGEGYVSQTEIFITSVGVGLTDWLTLQAGTILPVLFLDARSMPFIVAIKAGGSPGRYLHLAAGFQVVGVPGYSELPAAGFLFGTVTLGTEDLHLSVSAGPPFAFDKSNTTLGAAIVSVSANWRVARMLALVTENWFVPVNGRTQAVGSLVVRFLGEHLAVDAGFVFVDGAQAPLPWLDFTWHWNGPGRVP